MRGVYSPDEEQKLGKLRMSHTADFENPVTRHEVANRLVI